MPGSSQITDVIGRIPYRMAFAGGWIDQPFVSKLNPQPPGSMVVVQIEPTLRMMDRSGMATGTRRVALEMWRDGIPKRPYPQLVRELYAEENKNLTDPSGSQDMIGLVYPGISRLDYDFQHEGGIFPRQIENNTDPMLARWIEQVINVVPVGPRPEGYNPLETKNLDPKWIAALGQSGKDCFDAILARDIKRFGQSLNRTTECWRQLLPNTLTHRTLTFDLIALLSHYQSRYHGAIYSGCGGGYLYVVSDEPVPGSFKVKVRTGE
jgi:hypothetical protein